MEFFASAKYVLTGEHAVLRGSGAIVFPLHQYKMKLTYKDTGTKFGAVECQDDAMKILFHGALAKSLSYIGRPQDFLTGSMSIDHNIPIGMGLGFSAALSSVISKMLISLDLLDPKDFFDCAMETENYFHGTSSGIDIAGANAETGIYFSPSKKREEIALAWQPKIFLKLSGGVGLTSAAISLAQKKHHEDPDLAMKIDRDMQASVLLAQRALADSRWGFELLKESISLASSCFERWGLISDSLREASSSMTEAGAVATKCTGSGGGGAMLGLWEHDPISTDGLVPGFQPTK